MHIEKAKAAQAIAFMLHDTRSCKNHTNEKIDTTKSHLNYNLVSGSPLENYHKRMNEVYMRKSKSANTLAMFSTTLPKDFPIERSKEFFEQCHEFYAKKFGSENIISDIVHMDETTPHLHTKFIPVYYNEKKQRNTVSFDKVVNRSVYRSIHKDLKKHLEQHFGFHVAILNGATAGGNMTIQQMKSEEMDQELNHQFAKIIANDEKLRSQEKKIKAQEERIERLNKAIKHNRELINKQEEKYNSLKSAIQSLIETIKPLERLKGMLELVRERAYEFGRALTKIETRYDISDDEEKSLREFWRVIDGTSDIDKAIDHAYSYEKHKGSSRDDDPSR